MKITREEWEAALADMMTRRKCDGLTCCEIAAAIGSSKSGATKQLHTLISSGKWEYIGDKSVTRIDGRMALAPSYRPVKAKK